MLGVCTNPSCLSAMRVSLGNFPQPLPNLCFHLEAWIFPSYGKVLDPPTITPCSQHPSLRLLFTPSPKSLKLQPPALGGSYL